MMRDRAESHRQAEARLRGDRCEPIEVVHRPARDGKSGAYLFADWKKDVGFFYPEIPTGIERPSRVTAP